MKLGTGWRHRALAGVTFGVVASTLSTQALAAPPTPPQATNSTTVSELVVVATREVSELVVQASCLKPHPGDGPSRAPRAIASFPARGTTVRPGLVVVRVTFDQPMACAGGFNDQPDLPSPCATGPREMLLSFDRRTVRTVCYIMPHRRYGLALGSSWSGNAFLNLGGVQANPASTWFQSSDGPEIVNICEALMEDPETAAQMQTSGKACGEHPAG